MSKITLTELEKSEVYGLEFTNPDTGNKIKVASGLTYPKETKAYQQAMSIVNRYLGKQKRNVIQPTPDDAKPEGSSDRPKFEKRPEHDKEPSRRGDEEGDRQKPSRSSEDETGLKPGMKIAKLIVRDREYKPVFIEEIKDGMIKIKGVPLMKLDTFKKLVEMGYFRVKR